MTLKQLQAFLALASTGSFAEAAATLYLSQPALSLIMKGFEDQLGGKLFERSTRHVALTAEGQAFLPVARQLLVQWQTAEEDLRLRFALKRGKVAIAAMPFFAATALPELLKRFKTHYPQLQVEIHDVIAEKVVELVASGAIELGITFEPPALNELCFTPLYQDRFIAILPPDLPVAQSSISWQQLLQNDFITLQQPSGIRRTIEAALAASGIALQVAYDCQQLATVGQLVANKFGVAVVPALCARQMSLLGVQCLPLVEPCIEKTVGVLSRPPARLSGAAKALLHEISVASINDFSTAANVNML